MEKQKRWQFYVILAVLVLTLYNILPTVFYYTKPLKSPVDATRAEQVAHEAIERANALEEDAKEWLASFSKLLNVRPTSIKTQEDNPGIIEVAFSTAQEAKTFRSFLARAGELIPFAPAQLEVYRGITNNPEQVWVARKIDVKINPNELTSFFHFTPKKDEHGQIAPLYQSLVYDRATQLALILGGQSKASQQLSMLSLDAKDPALDDLTIALARELADAANILGRTDSNAAKRFYSTFAQGAKPDADAAIKKFQARIDSLRMQLAKERDAILDEQKALASKGSSSDISQGHALATIESKLKALESGSTALQKNIDLIKGAKLPLTHEQIATALENGTQTDSAQILSLEGRNPFIESLVINWDRDKIELRFYPDVQKMRMAPEATEAAVFQKEKLSQLIINEIAHASRTADEVITPDDDSFSIALNTLIDSQSFLAFDLGKLAEMQVKQLKEQLNSGWSPSQGDLARNVYPIMDYADFSKLSPEDQKLGLIIYSPTSTEGSVPAGFRKGSIYVIARGLAAISQKYQQSSNAEGSQEFLADVNQLNELMQQSGFIGYSGASFGMAPEFSKDYIFELDDYYGNLLKATREDFAVKGSKRYAVLDFTNVEQRILARNKIDDKIQEDLLKWKEEYDSAQVDRNATSKYMVPKPTTNPYWQNFKLSFGKYFRGDDRKILKWGLDLSGGKTVRIGLRDHNNRVVTNPDDLKQAVNELYTRINKMGVSERNIHIENNNIVLDFPGSQNLSAAELVKASAMYFHIVNERFNMIGSPFKDAVNNFLQNVWNEAVVTNRKDVESINEIAWQHLGGDVNGQATRPRSDYAKILWDNGLRLPNPKEKNVSQSFNDTLSSVAIMRGDDFLEWDHQSHPLLFVFHNYALEGSSLNNIQVGYEAAKGNFLSFNVKRSYEGQDRGSGSPRDDFAAWTSQFAGDKIGGTPKEAYLHGKGWRMAVILNGTVISKPNLLQPLRDSGSISGHFSQREINQLAADLKAGSLSFTPKILSEQNVSPELGEDERTSGIIASLVAVALVVIAMVSYYRFAGLVASCAVILNILIMWGVLQNIDAALTLPTIAGIVLTIGMAVDANVLVFERIREEFKISGRIASAIQAGYRKAFSAIVDSNITTIIAALILIQFDSGPIKGFAVSLIIGIISSMFTALFMTRYFFAGWVQNPKNKKLDMAQFIGNTNFDFLARTRKAVVISLVLMALGTFMFLSQRNTMLGMDFTGGYSLVVDLQEKAGVNDYRDLVKDALLTSGATQNDVQVRELSRPNQIRIQMGISMEEKGHPFYQMPEVEREGKYAYSYQSNPRLVWVVDALQNHGLEIQKTQIDRLDNNWTVMSGQLSDTMRNNAILALGIALLSILLYITLRFEFKYALGAVVGLVHDVIITLGILAMFHWLGFPVQVDLQVIGAIMTIIGYSLNDTIIVFDRIREDTKLFRKMKFADIINHSLNVTLSRTLMTSGTTLLVLLALVILGGKSIFAFSLVMTIGVLVGTLSSLFIAAPVLLYFHNREQQKLAHDGSYSLKAKG